MTRIPPLPKAEWSPQLTTFIDGFRSSVRGDRPDEGRQSGANLLGTLARYPELARAFLTFNGHLLYGSALPARERELLILRVAHLRKCDYEWAQHTLLAEAAGMDGDEIARVAEGPQAPGWTAIDGALLAAAGELVAEGTVSEATWSVLARELDDQQLMDVVFTVGTYALVAMVLCTFGVEPEAGLAPYLPARQDPAPLQRGLGFRSCARQNDGTCSSRVRTQASATDPRHYGPEGDGGGPAVR